MVVQVKGPEREADDPQGETMPVPKLPRTRLATIGVLGAALLATPAAVAQEGDTTVSPQLIRHLSSSVAFQYYLTHPDQAPRSMPETAAKIQEMGRPQAQGRPPVPPGRGGVFNRAGFGLPQNEESIAACPSNHDIVLGGTNDYRSLLVNSATGWYLSTNGGKTVANGGLLPPLQIRGTTVPSGGDPVDVITKDCTLYAASLNYTSGPDFLSEPNGIGVYKTDVQTLANCPGGLAVSPECWPTRRIVAAAPNPNQPTPPTEDNPSHFYDKEWMDVGQSGSAGRVVWVTYSDFRQTGPGTDTLDFTASIEAVRCTGDLSSCTEPIRISPPVDRDVQFSDVTIGPDGRVFVTWARIIGELPGQGGEPSQPQTFVIKSRVAPAGSTDFGPTRVVERIEKPIPFGGTLHANDFRIATYPKNAVAEVNGKPRFFVTWEECAARKLNTICEYPRVKLSYSDDLGKTWTKPMVLSRGGDNYFPTISADRKSGLLAAAWYTTRRDPFASDQSVEFVSIDAEKVKVRKRKILTKELNDPSADPLLGPADFIGDYIEVFADGGEAWVHFNANYRRQPLLDGLLPAPNPPVNQQDNFLVRTNL